MPPPTLVSRFLPSLFWTLVIGEYLIESKGRYVPNVVRHLMLGAGVVVAAVIILRLVMNINLLALVALPTIAAAVVGVALKDTVARFFAGIELGKMVKEGDWITTLDREGRVTHIGLEHVTLMTRERDYVTLPNDNVIQSGVTNYSRPTTTHLCSIYVEAAYRTPPRDICAALVESASAVEDSRVIEQIGVVARRQASTLAVKQELDREASRVAERHPARPLIERIQDFLWGQAKI